jgi:AAHS family 4-hydroxybenzoate transporter-like MFS transporter
MSINQADQIGRVDISTLIDNSKIGRFQFGLLLMCGLCLIMDGFDVQAIGYVAPAIIKDWGVPRAALGPVFGAGLFGMLVGSLTLSMLADKVGRRSVLICATLFFAICMLATPRVTTIDQLLVIRFITGLGLGAIMPNAMALAGEYSPQRIRVFVMMMISCGFTFGALLGGFISVVLIAKFGWQAVFYFGGAVPLVLALFMIIGLPESLQILVIRNRNNDHVRRLVQRIDPSTPLAQNTVFIVQEPVKTGTPVTQLFRDGRAGVTILFWIMNFMNLTDLYFLSNWLPTIISASGHGRSTAILAGTALQLGGTIGTLAMGRIIDKVGFRTVLITSFLVSVPVIILIGVSGIGLTALFIVIVVAGFCIVGGQPAINALAATYYPASLRSTGVGWSLGVGRLGSILGPVMGGVLIGAQWPNSWVFMAAAVPAFISAMLMVSLGHLKGAKTGRGIVKAPA